MPDYREILRLAEIGLTLTNIGVVHNSHEIIIEGDISMRERIGLNQHARCINGE